MTEQDEPDTERCPGIAKGECHECGRVVCPDCSSHNTHEDGRHRLHCLDCGEINDAYSVRGPA